MLSICRINMQFKFVLLNNINSISYHLRISGTILLNGVRSDCIVTHYRQSQCHIDGNTILHTNAHRIPQCDSCYNIDQNNIGGNLFKIS